MEMATRASFLKKVKIILMVLAIPIIFVLGGIFAFKLLRVYLDHNEFARLKEATIVLGDQYSVIHSQGEAEAAIETWGVILNTNRLYYPTKPEYLDELNRQHEIAQEKIVRALENYSGKDFGTNVLLWEVWAKTNSSTSK